MHFDMDSVDREISMRGSYQSANAAKVRKDADDPEGFAVRRKKLCCPLRVRARANCPELNRVPAGPHPQPRIQEYREHDLGACRVVGIDLDEMGHRTGSGWSLEHDRYDYAPTR